jgi:hypothetical protein
MFKKIILTVAAVVCFASNAHAITVDVSLGDFSKSAYTYSTGGTVIGNIPLPDKGALSLSDARIFSGTGRGSNAPQGTLLDNRYINVYSGGSATFNLPTNGDLFGLSWGSIDLYNTLRLTDARGVTYTITGSEIGHYLSHISSSDPAQLNVIVTDPFADIVKVQLLSSGNSFEAGNFMQSAVPLSGSAAMMLIALSGLVLFSLRKRMKHNVG